MPSLFFLPLNPQCTHFNVKPSVIKLIEKNILLHRGHLANITLNPGANMTIQNKKAITLINCEGIIIKYKKIGVYRITINRQIFLFLSNLLASSICFGVGLGRLFIG
jgi:hypothetical protein